MELLNQQSLPPPSKIVLKVEELTRKYDSNCEDSLHFRRLPCKCQFHSHCLIRAMLRDGIDKDGSFRCKFCLNTMRIIIIM